MGTRLGEGGRRTSSFHLCVGTSRAYERVTHSRPLLWKINKKHDWPVASELVPFWHHAFPFLFTTTRARKDHPIRQMVPRDNRKKLRVVWFRNNRVEREIGLTWKYRVLRINLVRKIEGPLYSDIPCLLLESSCCLSIHVKFAYRMKMTIPVSVRFSLTQTLQGIQYQLIEATIYPPTVTLNHTESFETQDRAKFTLCQVHAVFTHRPNKRSQNGSVSYVWLNRSSATRSVEKAER